MLNPNSDRGSLRVAAWGLSFLVMSILAACACAAPSVGDDPQKQTQVPGMESKESSEPLPAAGKKKDYIPGQVVVKFKPQTDLQSISRLQQELQLETIRMIASPDLYLMKILGNTTVEQMIEGLGQYESVSYAEPNFTKTLN